MGELLFTSYYDNLELDTLGGKEKITLKELAEVLGKETIDLCNTSDTRGASRSYGLNYQKTGKDMPYLFVKSSDVLKIKKKRTGTRSSGFFTDKYDIYRRDIWKE